MKKIDDDFLCYFSDKKSAQPKQPGINGKIIRFFSLTKALHLLNCQKLHFTRLDKFNDINEGLWTDEDNGHWQRYKDFNILKFTEFNREKIAINCWSKLSGLSSDGCNKLWNEYICNSQGLAMITTVDSLCRDIRKGLENFANFIVAEVDYVDRQEFSNLGSLKANDLLPNITTPCYQKDKAYSFEQEVRVLIHAVPKDKQDFMIEEFGVDIPINTKDFIHEILLPPKISHWERDVLYQLVSSYHLESKIR